MKLLLYLISFSLSAQPLEFVILVTSYNNEKYVQRNLDSLVNQQSQFPYQIICVNDCSSDATGRLMDEYAAQFPSTFLKIIHNTKRVGSALENIYNVVHSLADHKIVVCVDGDDTLAHNHVLQRLEKAYEDTDIWMTFGRFVVYPAGEFWSLCAGYPDEVIRSRTFRKHSNVPSHLKTFRAKLFKQIKKQDLLDPAGGFYKKAWDMAMLFPMLEMCAPAAPEKKNHSMFISDMVLYVYNFNNPISDFKVDGGRLEQIKLDKYIRSLPPYEPLLSL